MRRESRISTSCRSRAQSKVRNLQFWLLRTTMSGLECTSLQPALVFRPRSRAPTATRLDPQSAALAAFGIEVEAMHHEVANGQRAYHQCSLLM